MFVDVKDNKIRIKNMNMTKLLARIKNLYEEKNIAKIFDQQYSKKDLMLYNMKIIKSKDKMKIATLECHLFFALEILTLFEELDMKYNSYQYRIIMSEIRQKTWVGKKEDWQERPIDMSPLNGIRYDLKSYQSEFIKTYNTRKINNSLHGLILSFDQGLGKTLTSIALAECLNVQKVYIVCPNSLKENWAAEIKQYFYKYENNEKLYYDEVFIVGGKKKFQYNADTTKYVIVNQEAIAKLGPYVDNKSNMIIVDESHNFRNFKGKRVIELIQFAKKIKCKDILLMSGTPIKALPNEIIPSMLLIDPYFDMEAAAVYNRMFNVDSLSSSNIVKNRFKRIIHRRTKDEVLKLPTKHVMRMPLTVKKPGLYEVESVTAEVKALFEKYMKEEQPNFERYKREYIEMLNQHKMHCPSDEFNLYMKFVNNFPDKGLEEYHEVDQIKIEEFTKTNIYPRMSSAELKIFKRAETMSIRLKESCMGRAVGQILSNRRAEMFITMFEENKKKLIDMIVNNDKKTVIFSSSLPVIKHLQESLEKEGIDNVAIVGGTANRMDLIDKWKKDDNCEVLLATSQTLSTGVTLIEANQMFFFGTPWRQADQSQCEDRIYRIGQTTDVHIYITILKSSKPNLSTRMDDILNWSDIMFTGFMEQ